MDTFSIKFPITVCNYNVGNFKFKGRTRTKLGTPRGKITKRDK